LNPPPTVVLLGDVMVDMVARLDGPLVHGSDSPAHISSHGGGAAANTACWLVEAGAHAVLLGRVGQDAAGRAVEADLRSAGVEARLTADPELATGVVLVLVDPDGERTMVPDAGANASLRPEHLPRDVFRRGRHLHLSGYTLLKPQSRAAGRAALDLARRAGMTVSADAASAGPLASAGPRRFLDWIAGADVLFANEQEALLLAGMADPPHAAARALADVVGTAVVKLGADGALAQGPDGESAFTAAHTAAAATDVDTTGAGDAFAAGFLLAWLASARLDRALTAGAALAGRAILATGARPEHQTTDIMRNICI
jgi:sugar/nucleoside kinase (ribokinase family)